MIGAIIGAGMSAASALYGGISNRDAMREYANSLENQKNENKAWYDLRYNEDPLQRAGAQAMMTAVVDQIKRSNRSAAGRQAVTGGTEESVAGTKEANANSLAKTASSIVAANDARRDNVESQYLLQDRALQQKIDAQKIAKAQNIAAAMKGVGSAAGAIATSLDTPAQKNTVEIADVSKNMKDNSEAIDRILRSKYGDNYGISFNS